MPYSPLAIANYFIHRSRREKRPVDPLKLQKLVYYGHGWHLAIRNRPLINENVEAWQYGPVIPSVYHEFKKYGSDEIDFPAFELRDGRLVPPAIAEDDQATLSVLDRVWNVYGNRSGLELSNLTHRPGTPWAEVWFKQRDPDKIRGEDIPDRLIKQHFTEQVMEKRRQAAG